PGMFSFRKLRLRGYSAETFVAPFEMAPLKMESCEANGHRHGFVPMRLHATYLTYSRIFKVFPVFFHVDFSPRWSTKSRSTSIFWGDAT
ncbi:hypothetical protein, partial [uncultured Bifidobacterium sp.]|uniref:hypothetical protein n=1 Tax=uncultured Bifidobacterium sp. TaxID=165187 RepID=UPI002606DDA4